MQKPAGQRGVHPVLAVILILLTSAPLLIYLLLPSATQRRVPPASSPPLGAPQNSKPLSIAPDDIKYVRLTPRHGNIIDLSNYPDIAALHTTRMSVDIDNLALPDAVDKFGTYFPAFIGPQGGYRNALAQNRLVDLHLKDAPLWEVLFEFSAQTAIPFLEVSKDLINASGPDTRPVHWCVAGPFATVVQKVIGIRSLAQPDSADPDIQLTLEAYAEPSLGNITLPNDADFTTLTDEEGRPITRAGPAVIASTGNRIQQRILTFPLKMPLTTAAGTTVKRIGHLEGTFPFSAVTRVSTLQTAGPTEARTETVDGMTVEILPLTRLVATGPAAARAPFRLQLKFSQGTMPDKQWAGIANAMRNSRPQVFTASQQPIIVPATGPSGTGRAFSVNYTISGVQAEAGPHHFSLEIPVEWSEVRVPFEFTDIPLP